MAAPSLYRPGGRVEDPGKWSALPVASRVPSGLNRTAVERAVVAPKGRHLPGGRVEKPGEVVGAAGGQPGAVRAEGTAVTGPSWRSRTSSARLPGQRRGLSYRCYRWPPGAIGLNATEVTRRSWSKRASVRGCNRSTRRIAISPCTAGSVRTDSTASASATTGAGGVARMACSEWAGQPGSPPLPLARRFFVPYPRAVLDQFLEVTGNIWFRCSSASAQPQPGADRVASRALRHRGY